MTNVANYAFFFFASDTIYMQNFTVWTVENDASSNLVKDKMVDKHPFGSILIFPFLESRP